MLVELCFAPSSPDSRPDGSLRLCMQLLDHEQLGVPAADAPPILDKGHRAGASAAQHTSASREEPAKIESLDDVQQALHKRLADSDRLYAPLDVEQPRDSPTSTRERLMQHESYLAWAALSADNYVHLPTFPRTPSPQPPEKPAFDSFEQLK